jgi:hypothetical protein
MDIYTPLEEAKEEIWRRWNDKVLREEVAQFLGDIPGVCHSKPRAYLFRNVASPNNECGKFLELARTINLKPIVGEYLDDKFVSMNSDKLSLARMAFFQGWNKNREAIIRHRCVIDCTAFDGISFKEIKTLWGEELIAFLRRLFLLNSLQIELFDISPWVRVNGSSIVNIYQQYLALFICHGVLFEEFITNEAEKVFYNTIVLPAFKKVRMIFGRKPIIVSLTNTRNLSTYKYCLCYPGEIEQEVIRCLSESAVKESSGHHHEGR